jgi:hypothetical protein
MMDLEIIRIAIDLRGLRLDQMKQPFFKPTVV